MDLHTRFSIELDPRDVRIIRFLERLGKRCIGEFSPADVLQDICLLPFRKKNFGSVKNPCNLVFRPRREGRRYSLVRTKKPLAQDIPLNMEGDNGDMFEVLYALPELRIGLTILAEKLFSAGHRIVSATSP